MNFLESFLDKGPQQHHQDYQNYYGGQQEPVHEEHKGSLIHEGIAGAAGFAAVHAYEEHLRKTGEEPQHEKMLEFLGAIAAAEADKLVETHGMNAYDEYEQKKKANTREAAQRQAYALAADRYGGYGNVPPRGGSVNYQPQESYRYGPPPQEYGGYQGGYQQEGYQQGGYQQGGYQQGGYQQGGYQGQQY